MIVFFEVQIIGHEQPILGQKERLELIMIYHEMKIAENRILLQCKV